MDYEVVYLEEKQVAGLQSRTSNMDPHMTEIIGRLWQGFFEKGIYEAIPHKKNDKSIGLYTNYEGDASGLYDMVVCCEVEDILEIPNDMYTQTIPAGKYAKFVVKGDVQKAVGEFWMALWSMDLDRKYSCDFEEYQSDEGMNHSEIHIYIALN